MSSDHQLQSAIRDGIARGVAAIGLAGIALIHLLDAPGKFQETPYMGVLYVGLMAGSVLLAGVLIRSSHSRVWAASGALAVSVILGYTLSRTVGLPQATGDIGNWGEPLGVASLFVEGSLVALAGGVLAARARRREARPAVRRRSPELATDPST